MSLQCNHTLRCGSGVVLAGVLSGCTPELVVGAWECPPADAVASADKVVDVGWATGFETGFCDYQRAGGFCYAAPDASFSIVEAPARSGNRAAAFSITTDPAADGPQARCVREGALPDDAVYGAWFYLPSSADAVDNWNLIHFQGGPPGSIHGLWDVSLSRGDDGSLSLYLLDFLHGTFRRVPGTAAQVPIGSWFHVEFRLQRASDTSGSVALSLDGVQLLELAAIATDDTDFGQWYIGNLGYMLTPSDATLYLDDVTISAPP